MVQVSAPVHNMPVSLRNTYRRRRYICVRTQGSAKHSAGDGRAGILQVCDSKHTIEKKACANSDACFRPSEMYLCAIEETGGYLVGKEARQEGETLRPRLTKTDPQIADILTWRSNAWDEQIAHTDWEKKVRRILTERTRLPKTEPTIAPMRTMTASVSGTRAAAIAAGCSLCAVNSKATITDDVVSNPCTEQKITSFPLLKKQLLDHGPISSESLTKHEVFIAMSRSESSAQGPPAL